MQSRRTSWAALVAAGLALTPLAQVQAQSAAYPSKGVNLLVGSPPGSPSDITTRLFGEQFSQRTQQAVVVENRTGVGNSLAAGVVAKAKPDGYTLVVSPDTVVKVNPLVYRQLDFDARTDLVSVSVLASFSQMLVCNPGVGVKSVPELVARAKSKRLMYASGGAGSPGHLATEMFLETAGATMEHVPYRGPAPATMAVLSGEVDCGFLATPTVLQHVKAGKLAALAISSAQPSPLAPEVPTLAKALNQPQLDISFKLVLQAPKDTPAAVLQELERIAGEIMKKPEVRSKLQASDLIAVGSSTKEATALMQAETARWAPLVKRLDLKVE